MFGKVKIVLPKALLDCGTDRSLFTISHPALSHTQGLDPAAQESFMHPHAHLDLQSQRGSQELKI